jgi:hypothetical protein
MANYWTTLKCTTNGGSGGVSSTFSKSVQPGKSVTFTPTFSVSTGGTINCQICFENWGVPKPGGGIDYSQKFSKCNDVGSYTAKRGCECKDFKDSEGVPYQSSCASGSVGVNTQNFGGSAGSCTACRTCSYDNSSWTGKEPSNVCEGTTYTRTLQSSVKYGGTTFTSGCPQQTKQATGTGVPSWGVWTPGEGTKCASAGPFTQTQTDTNGYCSPQTKQATGIIQPDWSDCVGGYKSDRNGCAQDEVCDDDCECPAGWSSAAPPSSGANACSEGQTLQTIAGPVWSDNPCQTCYRCVDDDEDGCEWQIIEVGYGVVYESGTGTPPSSWTPPTYSYNGYMELQRNCGDGWATEQQWTTRNGGPTQSLS